MATITFCVAMVALDPWLALIPLASDTMRQATPRPIRTTSSTRAKVPIRVTRRLTVAGARDRVPGRGTVVTSSMLGRLSAYLVHARWLAACAVSPIHTSGEAGQASREITTGRVGPHLSGPALQPPR